MVYPIKREIFVFILVVLILSGSRSNAQDPAFSQAYASPMYLSPSFTGLTNGSRVALSVRDQWPGIPNTYRTIAFSYDQFLSDYNSGVGVLLLRDDKGGGQLINQTAGVLYSYEIELTHKLFVRPGIQFKYTENRIDPTKLIYMGSDGKPIQGTTDEFAKNDYKKFDATVSGMIYSDFFWFGFSFDHLIKNNVGFTDIETNIPLKTVIYGGYKFKYKEGYKHQDEQSVTLAANYYRQQDFQQLDMGAYWYINPLELGLLYRGLPFFQNQGYSNSDAIIMILGINFGSMRFAYSYDLSTSDLAGYSNGANEFSFIYRFNQTYKKRGNRGAVPCSEPGVFGTSGQKYRTSPRRIF
jgi:type IX secretion system PorP/SprF family membrane protein